MAGVAARTFNGPALPGRAPRSWEQGGIARGRSPSPAASRRLSQPSGRGGHAIRGPVLRAAQEPRAARRQGGRPALPSLSGLLGGATSVPYSGRERTQLVPGSAPRRRHNGGGIDADSTASLPPASNFPLNLAAPRRDAAKAPASAPAWPRPAPRAPRAPGGGPGALGPPTPPPPGAASRTARARAQPPTDPPLGPGREDASPPLGAGDRREGGAAARPGSGELIREAQVPRRPRAPRSGRVKVNAQRRLPANSPRRPKSWRPGRVFPLHAPSSSHWESEASTPARTGVSLRLSAPLASWCRGSRARGPGEAGRRRGPRWRGGALVRNRRAPSRLLWAKEAAPAAGGPAHPPHRPGASGCK